MHAYKIVSLESGSLIVDSLIEKKLEWLRDNQEDIEMLIKCKNMTLAELRTYYEQQLPEMVEIYRDYSFDEFEEAIQSDYKSDVELLKITNEEIRLLRLAGKRLARMSMKLTRRSLRHRNTFVLFWPVVDSLYLFECFKKTVKEQLMKLRVIERPESNEPRYHLITTSNN